MEKKLLLGEAQRWGRVSHRARFGFSHQCSESVLCPHGQCVGGSARSGAGVCAGCLEIQLLALSSFFGAGDTEQQLLPSASSSQNRRVFWMSLYSYVFGCIPFYCFFICQYFCNIIVYRELTGNRAFPLAWWIQICFSLLTVLETFLSVFNNFFLEMSCKCLGLLSHL